MRQFAALSFDSITRKLRDESQGLKVRYLVSVLASVTLIFAAGLSQPYRTAQAQRAHNPTMSDTEFVVGWGVWPRVHIGMSEEQLLSIIQTQVGAAPAPLSGPARSLNKTYTFGYRAAGSQVSERITVDKARKIVSFVGVAFEPALPCEQIVQAYSLKLGDPELGPQAAISFGGSGDESLARWRDTIRGQVIAMGFERQVAPRTCAFITIQN